MKSPESLAAPFQQTPTQNGDAPDEISLLTESYPSQLHNIETQALD